MIAAGLRLLALLTCVALSPATAIGQASETPPDVQLLKSQAEIRRIEAEVTKLELEAEEIERRLTARWWHDDALPQYLLAIAITAALLFGWTRAYLEPILSLKGEIHKLAEERDRLRSDALERDNQQIKIERASVVADRDRLHEEKGDLERKQHNLQSVVAGLKVAVDQADKGQGRFFSILNPDDPIGKLRKDHGWTMFSDNWIGPYHLVITHPDVRSGKQIVVLRTFDVEDRQKAGPKAWKDFVAKAGQRHGRSWLWTTATSVSCQTTTLQSAASSMPRITMKWNSMHRWRNGRTA